MWISGGSEFGEPRVPTLLSECIASIFVTLDAVKIDLSGDCFYDGSGEILSPKLR